MGSWNLKDLVTSFSPSLDYFAISSGDGRIKIWDTLTGQVQTEFADIASTLCTDLFTKPERGHLSVDYTCMKWLSLERKRKRKLGSSLLALGTGSGDVLALDVSAGQLKWRISDCHPGGVSAISFSTNNSCIYTAGADGMICEIDPLTGNLLRKFKASTKAISCMSVSPDGKVLATAAGQLKTFNCFDRKKIQKFSGHPGAVRCMIFSEDGKYILSSAVGERYIAVWSADDDGKKQSASCVLAMDHPAIFIDTRCIGNAGANDLGLCVLAISESGICYFWFAQNVEELRNTKPTKVSSSSEEIASRKNKGAFPAIFAAKLQAIAKPASLHAFVAHGMLVKPLFEKIIVHSGTDIELNSSQEGILLPRKQSFIKSRKGLDIQKSVTVLDRANAEEALRPIPLNFYIHEKTNGIQNLSADHNEVMADLADGRSQAMYLESKDDMVREEANSETFCMENRLRSMGILSGEDGLTSNSALNSTAFMGINLDLPQKKIRAVVLAMEPGNAYKLLGSLVEMWHSRSCSGKFILPWINSILVNHSHYVKSQESATQILNSLHQISKSRGVAIQPLLQLAGRLQLITAQIDKAVQNTTQVSVYNYKMDDSEDEDEDVDDLHYVEEEGESELSSDGDN
ncbi:WD40 domain-containing protein/Utp12 domain-containing protein [Cephalotus follicularis]|uniref:WD40 domain-containing protein/Utp12 domain-containing protein n=1 Tax=Cephalotus follicularis TaxID=3775 RepID=A0A1Q3B855_CEPFO|nr:WD40 domain-containing protein/Utp12 domain-containing protein [Cephalotus follicularis]